MHAEVGGDIQVLVLDSASVVEGSTLETDTAAYLVREVTGHTLRRSLTVSGRSADTLDDAHPPVTDSLAAGTRVTSYLVHVDTKGGGKTILTGSLRLPAPVVAVIASGRQLDVSDARLGNESIRYPASGQGHHRSINVQRSDALRFSADRRTVEVEIHNWAGADQVRILTR